MGATDFLLLANTGLIGLISFMGKRYFERVEGHLKENHRLITKVTEHELRLDGHERRIRRLEKTTG